MSLDNTLQLKNVAGTEISFSKVDQPAGQPGTRRVDVTQVSPAANVLLIRHQPTGKSFNKGQRHTVTMQLTRPDAAGVLIQGAISLSLNIPDNGAITFAAFADALHQIIDILAPASTVVLDESVLKALFRGES